MIKSIFVDPTNISGIEKSNADHLIVALTDLNESVWNKLKSFGFALSVTLTSFDDHICPVDPAAKEKLFTRIEKALSFNPKEVWLDFLRFGGDCTDIENSNAVDAHKECQWCKGINRQEHITSLADEIKNLIGDKAQVGFFAVVFKDTEAPDLAKVLGLNYQALGAIFDLSSPMLYHRMIKKPVTYISKYVKYMSEKTGKKVLPIIQVKDMPDDLLDEMTEEEITQAFNEAIKDPSMGVCFFGWNHALEKNKTQVISHLFL